MSPILVVLLLLALPVAAGIRAAEGSTLWILGGWAAVLSLIGWILIASDKKRAGRGHRRIPEATLHWVEVLGGWPGSYLAQQRYRHKTVKASYRLVLWAIIGLYQIVALDVIRGWPWLRALGDALGQF